MSRLLPAITDDASFDAMRRDEAQLRPGLDAICARHGLLDAPRTRFSEGSVPVYALGEDVVLKLFPPMEGAHFDNEQAFLRGLHGRLPIPTPKVIAAGHVDGWPYLLMSRLRGEALSSAWRRLPRPVLERLMGDLGRAMAVLHALPVGDLAARPPQWEPFIAAQRAGCVAQHERKGLTGKWRDRISEFLREVPVGAPSAVLLHTELMRAHLLVDGEGAEARLSGLVDFEPSMVGAPGYELASVGLFVTCGDRALFRTVIEAYDPGLLQDPEALARRCMAYALLHRYANLRWYLERMPPAPRVDSLPALADQWFGTRPPTVG